MAIRRANVFAKALACCALLGMLGQMLGAYEVMQERAEFVGKQNTTVQQKLIRTLVKLALAQQHDLEITKKHAEIYWALRDLMLSVRSGKPDQIAASLELSDQMLAR